MVFSNDKKQASKRRGASTHEVAVTILTSGCHFEGKLFCKGSSRIGGKIEGEILSEGLLIIEEEAHIVANIKADEAVIQGTVRGKLEARERVELAASCCFEGEILTPCLIVQEGATFNGMSAMPKDPSRFLPLAPQTGSLDKSSKSLKNKPIEGAFALPEVGLL